VNGPLAGSEEAGKLKSREATRPQNAFQAPAPTGKRKHKPFSFPSCRLREIERTIPTRDLDQIRAVLPEVAATYRLIIVLGCRGMGEGDLEDRMQQWCDRMRLSRVFSENEIEEAIDEAEARNRLAPADKLAAILGLEYADRQRLAICTIGAIDMTKRQRTIERKERKREKDRIRMAVQRRAAGIMSREDYLAESLSRSRPWEREGIKRRQWERRRARRDASVSPPQEALPSDGLASSGSEPPGSRQQQPAFEALRTSQGVAERWGDERSEQDVETEQAASS
jgi:hypothetical protein